MNSIFNPFLLHLLSFMITFGIPLISGQETPVQSLSNPVLSSGGSPTSEIYRYSTLPPRSTLSYVPLIENAGSDKKTISYLIGTERVSFFHAYVLCKQSGMELASISSPEEEMAVESYTRKIAKNVGPQDGYWLAGTRHGSSGSEFVWLTTGKPVIYRNFAPGQPDNAGGNEACLQFYLDSPNNFAWNDGPCDQKIGYICQS